MSAMTIDTSDIRGLLVGDIIKVDGKNYKIEKKACTAIAVSRYYWFDALWDRTRRVMGAH